MTRAKHRAGIPVSDTPKPKKSQVAHWQATVKKILDPDQKSHLQSRLQNLHFRKPAGINERLVKISKEIIQPENPHLIKVAVIGAANAGKSTLVNKIVREEVKL